MNQKVILAEELREFDQCMTEALGHIRELVELSDKKIPEISPDLETKLVWYAHVFLELLKTASNRSARELLDDLLE